MIAFTIFGEPASKANSREIVTFGRGDNKRAAVIKSEKARGYEDNALRQIPPRARVQLKGPVRVTVRIFYATERPDLDESVVLDVLQDRWASEKRDKAGNVTRPKTLLQRGVYVNDRQVREKHVFHGIDKANPRAEITVEPLQAQQHDLLGADEPFADQFNPAGVAF